MKIKYFIGLIVIVSVCLVRGEEQVDWQTVNGIELLRRSGHFDSVSITPTNVIAKFKRQGLLVEQEDNRRGAADYLQENENLIISPDKETKLVQQHFETVFTPVTLKNQQKGFKLTLTSGLRHPVDRATTHVSYIALSDAPAYVDETDVLNEHRPEARQFHDTLPTPLDDIMAVTLKIPQALKNVIPITGETRDNLFWYLAASKKWDLLGDMAATYRDRLGVNPQDDESYCKLVLHFAPHPGGHDSEPPTPVSVLKESIRLDLYKNPLYAKDFGHYAFGSSLYLDLLNKLWVYMDELDVCTSRNNTLEGLNLVAALINEASKGKDAFYPKLLADGSMMTAEGAHEPFSVSDVEITDQLHNIQMVKGYINPNVKGLVSFAMYDKETNALLNRYGFKSFTGWSDNANEFFYFEVTAPMIDGDEPTRDVRMDLVFTPAEGELQTTIPLLSTNCTVVTFPRK